MNTNENALFCDTSKILVVQNHFPCLHCTPTFFLALIWKMSREKLSSHESIKKCVENVTFLWHIFHIIQHWKFRVCSLFMRNSLSWSWHDFLIMKIRLFRKKLGKTRSRPPICIDLSRPYSAHRTDRHWYSEVHSKYFISSNNHSSASTNCEYETLASRATYHWYKGIV